MARSTTASRSRTADRPAAANADPVGLELAGVALCLASVLLLAALLSFRAGESPGGFENVVGSWGRGVAGALLRALGIGAWVLPAFGVAWGVRCLRGRRPGAWGRRALLLPLLAVLGAAFGALIPLLGHLPGLQRYGPGGYLGVAMGSALFGAFGKAAGIVAAVGFLGLLRLLVDVPLGDAASRLWARLLPEGAGGTAVADEEDAPEDALEDDDEDWDDEDEDWEDDEDYEEEEVDEAVHLEDDAEAAPPPARRSRVAARPARRKRSRKKKTRKDQESYVFPPLDLLDRGEEHDEEVVAREVEENAEVLAETLASFGVEADVVSSQRGPVITFYEIAVASGVRLNRITALADDLAIALKAPSVRIVAPIPGRSTVGVEVPNITREMVVLRDLIEEGMDACERKAVPVFLGRDTAGRPIVEDLATMPHVLVAGATGSGKSVCINSIILSVLYTRTPEEISLILVDPKQVELSFFEGLPHLITPVVTDMKRAAKILEWAVEKMEERYALLLAGGVRNIAGYNALPKEKIAAMRERTGQDEEEIPAQMPRIVIVVDELADLLMTNGKEVEIAITRLAQKSRAVGIHIILATQRPSTNVITGLIKANMPTRVAFCVSSKIDSRVILDANGADKLLGMGDMLFMHPRSLHLRRAQGTLVTDAESRAVVDYLAEHGPEPEYQDLLAQKKDGLGDPMKEDDLYDDAVRVVLTTRLGSASMLQRRLGVGYTRASRLVDMMCDHGVVGPHVGSKAREVLLTMEEWEAQRAGQGHVGPVDDDEDLEVVDESWD